MSRIIKQHTVLRWEHNGLVVWRVVWPPSSAAVVKNGFVVQPTALAAGFGH